ncbi:hypothetical protein J2Z30_005062 [Streptomyces iranensis]|uniref:Peptidase C14 caspase domain-containing protein n=1 Tax=Streptomyces iranensis TaxID=576784 RepID=A0ABS4MWC9_9ACTN|nr:hypothetical protein [Streptomyces iranensis]
MSNYVTLPKLPTVRKNVESLRNILTGAASWNLPPEHCDVIHDPRSPEELVDPILEAAEEATDALLVYYAGHGIKGPNRGELRLTRTTTRQRAPYTATQYDDIRDILIDSSAPRRIVILDCCYAASALGTMADPGNEIAEDALIEGTYLIAAAGETEAAMAEDGTGFTAFTGELIRLLQNGVQDAGKILLDLDTIFTNLERSLRAKSRPRPHRRVRNSPGNLGLAWNFHWLANQHVLSWPDREVTERSDGNQEAELARALLAQLGYAEKQGDPVANIGETRTITSPREKPHPPPSPTTTPVPHLWPVVTQRPVDSLPTDNTSRARQLWPAILEAVKNRRRFTWILLAQNAHISNFDGTTLQLSFSNPGSRDSFTAGGSEEVVRKALREEFNLEWNIEAISDPASTGDVGLHIPTDSAVGNHTAGESVITPPRGSWPIVAQRPVESLPTDNTSRARQLWPAILEAVKNRRRFTWILLAQNAHISNFDGTTLQLSFSNPGSRDSFTAGGSEEVVRKALREEFNLEWNIEAISDPPTATRPDPRNSTDTTVPPSAIANVKQHPETQYEAEQRPAPQKDVQRKLPSLEVGDQITHESFGHGTVIAVGGSGQNSEATIDFGQKNTKRLLLRYAPVVKL